MINLIKNLIKKYKDFILYAVFGVLTTLVNIVCYYICTHIFSIGVVVGSIIAWVVAVLFAYLTNRKWVFHSKATTKKEILKEIILFFNCRLTTGIIDWLIMFVFVDVFSFNDLIIKLISNVIVIILNFIFSKLIVFNNKKEINIKSILKEVGILVFLFAITFLILLNSPINIWQKGFIATDQGVFETIAMMMKKGYMPYRDTFDHKGPLMYLYNYIGLSIEYYKGIWYIEFINLFVTLYFFYKTARLKCNRIISVILVFLTTSTFIYFFAGGNMTEEFALPFIAVSLYISLDYLSNDKINKLRLMTCGFSLGGVLLLRPNMISLWIVFCISVLIKCIKEKKYVDLRTFIIFFLIGMFVIIAPFLIWLGINNALVDFWNDYIIFNFKYVKVSEHGVGLPDKIKSLWFFASHILVIVSLIVNLILLIIKKEKIYFTHLIYIILTLILICLPGNTYGHYGLILMPISIFVLSSIIANKNKVIKYVSLIIILGLCIPLVSTYYNNAKSISSLYNNRNHIVVNSYFDIVNIIVENTSESDTISIYGNFDTFYVLSERKHATKYSYTYPISNFNPKIKDEYFTQLQEEKPKLIIVNNIRLDDRMSEFLETNGYILFYTSSITYEGYFQLYKID